MAITAIQKQLMQFETGPFSGSPPAYAMHNQQMANNFPPPPHYPQRRLPPQVPGNAQGAQGPRMPINQNSTALSRIQYERTKLAVALEKERLLQQQKVQQIVVPVNATTSGKKFFIALRCQNCLY